MYSINNWCGRFGNNIQQISNAIFYAMENKISFSMIDNQLISPINLNFGSNDIRPGLYFFHVNSEIGEGRIEVEYDLEKLRKYRRIICRDIIYSNLKINFNNIKDLGDDTVVLQIRSGDIFSRKNYYCPVVSNYIQNPLSYYTNIIKNYKKIIVITEDYNNPVIGELEKIKNVEIKILTDQESIEILLSSRNFVTSGVSSFGIACALLSKNIKKLYCSNLYLNEILNYNEIVDADIELIIENIDQDRYIKWNEWLNTDEQKKLITEYVL